MGLSNVLTSRGLRMDSMSPMFPRHHMIGLRQSSNIPLNPYGNTKRDKYMGIARSGIGIGLPPLCKIRNHSEYMDSSVVHPIININYSNPSMLIQNLIPVLVIMVWDQTISADIYRSLSKYAL